MSELDLLRKENMKLKQTIEHYKNQQKEMVETILILKARIIDIQNHQAMGIDEELFETYIKTLKKR